MMTDRLKAVVKRIEQLPPEERERLLEQIEDALDNAQWHALLADPRSGPALDELIARAKQSPRRPWPPREEQISKSGEAGNN
jgi:hypothetical protein